MDYSSFLKGRKVCRKDSVRKWFTLKRKSLRLGM
jgi:hypothetical protein